MNTELWEQGESHLITWTGWMLGRRQGVTPGQVLQDLWKIKKAEEEHCKQKKNHEQKPRTPWSKLRFLEQDTESDNHMGKH